jgi:hypothetical protein
VRVIIPKMVNSKPNIANKRPIGNLISIPMVYFFGRLPEQYR